MQFKSIGNKKKELIALPSWEKRPSCSSFFIKLVELGSSRIELQFSRGDDKQHLTFDSLARDGLPGLATLLKNLQTQGHGRMVLKDFSRTWFLALDISSTGHVRFSHRILDPYNEIDIEWDLDSSVDHLITTLNQLIADILNHPDFLAGYAFYHWDNYREFSDRLEEAKREFFTTRQGGPFEDEQSFVPEIRPLLLLLPNEEEDRFERAWLRENILDLAPAREAAERYLEMLEGTSLLL